jgi:hypothetical protein
MLFHYFFYQIYDLEHLSQPSPASPHAKPAAVSKGWLANNTDHPGTTMAGQKRITKVRSPSGVIDFAALCI